MKYGFLSLLAVMTPLSQAEPSPVLGKIGGIEVATDEIRETIAGLELEQQASLSRDQNALGQYVRALLVQRLVLKQATDKKWDQEPAVIAKLVRTRESALTESFLQSVSEPEADYPSASALSEAYEANKDKLLIPRSFRLAQIFVAAANGQDPAAKSKLDTVLKRLKAKDSDFASIARASSEESASAAKGGEIGWLTENQIQPEIRAKLPKLTLHAVSDPILLNDGWHILKVLDIRDARTPLLDEVREPLIARLRAERAGVKRQEYIARLITENPPAINEIEISKLLANPAE